MKCLFCGRETDIYFRALRVTVESRGMTEKNRSRKGKGAFLEQTIVYRFNDDPAEEYLYYCGGCRKKSGRGRFVFSLFVLIAVVVAFNVTLRLLGFKRHGGWPAMIVASIVSLLFVVPIIYSIIFVISSLPGDRDDPSLALKALHEALAGGSLPLPGGVEHVEDAMLDAALFEESMMNKREGDALYMTSFEWEKIIKADYTLKLIYHDRELEKVQPRSLNSMITG